MNLQDGVLSVELKKVEGEDCIELEIEVEADHKATAYLSEIQALQLAEALAQACRQIRRRRINMN